MIYIALTLTALLAGFIAGLLVGRKNPKVADVALKVTEKVRQ